MSEKGEINQKQDHKISMSSTINTVKTTVCNMNIKLRYIP